MVFLLLNFGADPTCASKYLSTPLHYAQKRSVAMLLTRSGGTTTARNIMDQTPLSCVVHQLEQIKHEEEEREKVDRLLREQAARRRQRAGVGGQVAVKKGKGPDITGAEERKKNLEELEKFLYTVNIENERSEYKEEVDAVRAKKAEDQRLKEERLRASSNFKKEDFKKKARDEYNAWRNGTASFNAEIEKRAALKKANPNEYFREGDADWRKKPPADHDPAGPGKFDASER